MRKRSIRIVNDSHESTRQNTAWVFLAEYSLDELMRMVESAGEPDTGTRFQDLGISQECLNPIIRTLATFAQQAMIHAHPGAPAAIRVFYQERMLNAGKTAETMHPKQTIAGPEIIHPMDPKMTGGWGYFLVERSGDFREDRPEISPNLIDLYLYKEGK